jgi:hypothetical protein
METNEKAGFGGGKASTAQWARLIEAGWPAKVGPNSKRHASHNHLELDGRQIETFFAPGSGFWVYDARLGLVTSGGTRDAALLAMALARETAQSGERAGHTATPPATSGSAADRPEWRA